MKLTKHLRSPALARSHRRTGCPLDGRGGGWSNCSTLNTIKYEFQGGYFDKRPCLKTRHRTRHSPVIVAWNRIVTTSCDWYVEFILLDLFSVEIMFWTKKTVS